VKVDRHPYRQPSKSRDPAPIPDDWHDALRGPGASHSLRLALATLVGTTGVQLLFARHGSGSLHMTVGRLYGPGSADLAVELFVVGGIAVALFFVSGAIITAGSR